VTAILKHTGMTIYERFRHFLQSLDLVYNFKREDNAFT